MSDADRRCHRLVGRAVIEHLGSASATRDAPTGDRAGGAPHIVAAPEGWADIISAEKPAF